MNDLELPDILDDEVLPTSGIIVCEMETSLDIAWFTNEWMLRRYANGKAYGTTRKSATIDEV